MTHVGFTACVRTANSVPQGRLKIIGNQGCCPGQFSVVPTGLFGPSCTDPGLSSWATFSRPCGTEFAGFSYMLFSPLGTSFRYLNVPQRIKLPRELPCKQSQFPLRSWKNANPVAVLDQAHASSDNRFSTS